MNGIAYPLNLDFTEVKYGQLLQFQSCVPTIQYLTWTLLSRGHHQDIRKSFMAIPFPHHQNKVQGGQIFP